MEPTFHLGDLVLLRTADHYEVRDIVAYHHPQLGVVIHRIIARQGGRFVLQGDHNTWIDSYDPLPQDIIGKLWVYIPINFNWFQYRHSTAFQVGIPIGMGVLAAVVLFVGQPEEEHIKRKKRSTKPRSASADATGSVGSVDSADLARSQHLRSHSSLRLRNKPVNAMNKAKTNVASLDSVLFVLFVVGALSIGIGVVAFSQSTTHTADTELGYEHHATFAYTAEDPQGIFDNGRVETGQPIFREFTHAITTTFSYSFMSPRIRESGGIYRLVAEISDDTGWKRTLELRPSTAFTGTGFKNVNVLNLDRLQQLISHMQNSTKTKHPSYHVALEAQIFAVGSSGKNGWQDRFMPRLEFIFDETELRLTSLDQIAQTKKDALIEPELQPNQINLLLFKLDVTMARYGVVAGLVLVVSGLALVLYMRARTQPDLHIQSRYGSLLVTASHIERLPGVMVEVASIDDLMKLAERENGIVLHSTDAVGHHYFLQAGETLFHYVLSLPLLNHESVSQA